MALQQRQQQRLPHCGQWIRTASGAGFGCFGLEAACINAVGTAHRDARRSGSHLLAAAGSSFGHVQRNLLSGEGSRHGPVPCAWQPVSADPLRSGQPDRRDPSTRLSSDIWKANLATHPRIRDQSQISDQVEIGCGRGVFHHRNGAITPASAHADSLDKRHRDRLCISPAIMGGNTTARVHASRVRSRLGGDTSSGSGLTPH